MNKEALEEAVKQYSEKQYSTPKPLAICIDFAKFGAKWQQEQDNKFSEEEVINIIDKWVIYQEEIGDSKSIPLQQFLEQFKKK